MNHIRLVLIKLNRNNRWLYSTSNIRVPAVVVPLVLLLDLSTWAFNRVFGVVVSTRQRDLLRTKTLIVITDLALVPFRIFNGLRKRFWSVGSSLVHHWSLVHFVLLTMLLLLLLLLLLHILIHRHWLSHRLVHLWITRLECLLFFVWVILGTFYNTPFIYGRLLKIIVTKSLPAGTLISHFWVVYGALILLSHSTVVAIVRHTDWLALSLWGYISTTGPISKGCSWTQSIAKLVGSQLGLMSCHQLIVSLWQRLIIRRIIILLQLTVDGFGKQILLLYIMIVVFVQHGITRGQITLREHPCYLSLWSPTLVRILLHSAILFIWINFIYGFFLAFENTLQKFLQFWVCYHAKDSGEILLFKILGCFLIVFLIFLLDLFLFGIFRLLLLRWWNLFTFSLT